MISITVLCFLQKNIKGGIKMPKAKYVAPKNIKSIDQMAMAKIIATRLAISLQLALQVIELEQKLTMQYVKGGYKVVKKNYIIFTPVAKPGYILESKLDGQTYEVPDRVVIKTSLGQGFKSYVTNNGTKMPEKICRFVDKKRKSNFRISF